MALNENNLSLTKEWGKEVLTWTLKDIYGAVANVAVYLWPYDETPRNLEVVMDKFINAMQHENGVYSVGSTAMIDISLVALVRVIYNNLMTIKEFREWNLTKLEYAHGINPDDRSMNEYWRRSDKKFVDLEAFGQNVYCRLRTKLIEHYFFEI